MYRVLSTYSISNWIDIVSILIPCEFSWGVSKFPVPGDASGLHTQHMWSNPWVWQWLSATSCMWPAGSEPVQKYRLGNENTSSILLWVKKKTAKCTTEQNCYDNWYLLLILLILAQVKKETIMMLPIGSYKIQLNHYELILKTEK